MSSSALCLCVAVMLHPKFPGERLIACRNRSLARRRAATRESLVAATEDKLAAIGKRVAAGTLRGAAQIGLEVGEVINSRKVKKHFICHIGDDSLSWQRN